MFLSLYSDSQPPSLYECAYAFLEHRKTAAEKKITNIQDSTDWDCLKCIAARNNAVEAMRRLSAPFSITLCNIKKAKTKQAAAMEQGKHNDMQSHGWLIELYSFILQKLMLEVFDIPPFNSFYGSPEMRDAMRRNPKYNDEWLDCMLQALDADFKATKVSPSDDWEYLINLTTLATKMRDEAAAKGGVNVFTHVLVAELFCFALKKDIKVKFAQYDTEFLADLHANWKQKKDSPYTDSASAEVIMTVLETINDCIEEKISSLF